MSLKQYDSALIYLKNAYEIDSIKRNTSKLAARLDLIGLVYQRQGKNAKAEPLFAKALMFANHPNLITSKAIILSNYSKNAFYQENYKKAEEFAKASLELSTKLNLANTKIGNYLVLFDIYKKTQKTQPNLQLPVVKFPKIGGFVFF